MKRIVSMIPLVWLALLPWPASADAAAPVPPLEVESAWVRQPPPGARVAAGFLHLRNPGDATLRVSGVAVDPSVARSAEIHDMEMRDGMMRMRHLVEGVELAPGASAELAPGGRHVMLFGVHTPLQEGDRVGLTLRLEDGREIPVAAQVQREAP